MRAPDALYSEDTRCRPVWPLYPGVPGHAVSVQAPRLLSCRLEGQSSNSPVEKGEVFEWQQRLR